MSDLQRGDIRTAATYEAERDEERRRIADLKRHRRVNLGNRVSLVFENQETLRNAVEELVRTERISDEETIAAEVDAFNQLMPDSGELAACLYIEGADPAELTSVGDELRGVAETVSLKIGSDESRAFVHLVDAEDAAPLTYRLSFRLSPEQRSNWNGAPVHITVDHPACRADVELTGEQKSALAADL